MKGGFNFKKKPVRDGNYVPRSDLNQKAEKCDVFQCYRCERREGESCAAKSANSCPPCWISSKIWVSYSLGTSL